MKTDLFERIENSRSVDFGNVLSRSFELYQKFFNQGLTHSLVALLVVIPFIIIIYLPIIPIYVEILANAGDPYYTPTFIEQYSVGIIIFWYLMIFALSFLMQLVFMSVYGRFMKFMKNEDTGGNEDIGGYFTILKNHFGKLLLLTLASMGIALLAALLCYLPLFYAIVPLHWIFPMFIFNEDLSVADIIKAAFKFANKNWLIFFALGFVVSILASLGMIVCYIGLILTTFFTYIATYVTYRDSIGFDEPTTEITEFSSTE